MFKFNNNFVTYNTYIWKEFGEISQISILKLNQNTKNYLQKFKFTDYLLYFSFIEAIFNLVILDRKLKLNLICLNEDFKIMFLLRSELNQNNVYNNFFLIYDDRENLKEILDYINISIKTNPLFFKNLYTNNFYYLFIYIPDLYNFFNNHRLKKIKF